MSQQAAIRARRLATRAADASLSLVIRKLFEGLRNPDSPGGSLPAPKPCTPLTRTLRVLLATRGAHARYFKRSILTILEAAFDRHRAAAIQAKHGKTASA